MSGDGNIEAIYPLTPAQEGILFHTLLTPEAPLYLQQYTCVMDGTLDVELFQESWQAAVDRHAALRSLLTWEGRERPLQIVRKRVSLEWTVEDWQAFDDAEDRLSSFLLADRLQGFSLDVAPLMRCALFALEDGVHQFVWTHHHIILDGWSMGIVLKEVFATYEALLGGQHLDLDEPAPYRNFVQWLKGRDSESAESYWIQALSGFDHPNLLPSGSGRAAPVERHSEETVHLDEVATDRLSSFARNLGLTMNTVLRGAWATVLSRYSGESDVVFGTTFAGRPPELSDSMEMVGLFINTLPVRVGVTNDEPVVEWLRRIQQAQIDATPFEATPLVDVQSWSDAPNGRPLFESLLVFENVPNPTQGGSTLEISHVRYLQRSNYPLAVLVMPNSELELVFLYDADRFHPSIIQRMANQLVHVLKALPGSGSLSAAELSFFPEEEQRQLLHEWNDTAAEYPEDQTIHALFEGVARHNPTSVAVVGAESRLTYTELDRRATELARHITALGVGADDRVALCVPRSPAMMVGILGILKAGCAYVPIDPGLPVGRRTQLLESTSPKATITTEDAPRSELSSPSLITLGPDGEVQGGGTAIADEQSTPEVSPDDLAYVLHTSGSTGIPKGVAVTHRSLVNSSHARLLAYEAPVGTFLLLSPFGFDSSIAGIFASITQGGTLVLPGPGMEQDVHHVAGLIQSEPVSHVLLLPSLYELLLELIEPSMLESLELVMVAGEPCPPHLAAMHRARLPNTRLVNEYGPTEATVWCTMHQIHPAETDASTTRVPIGRPIANTQVYVLDGQDRPVPVGVAGELHVAGVGVARGYLDLPELTEDSFVHRDLDGVGAVRLYRTGDIARWLPDGTLDLIGRADHQIKIRGQRIELGEIESALRQYPSVEDVVVVVRDPTDSGASSLVAYVESDHEAADFLGADLLRSFLETLLPPAMVPNSFVVLGAFPRGSTGKLDRGALPEPSAGSKASNSEFVAPQGSIEQQLASVWVEVLGLDKVSTTDNFFTLGGDSILSIRIIARAHRLGLAITPKQFFDHPTIAGLARVVQTPSDAT